MIPVLKFYITAVNSINGAQIAVDPIFRAVIDITILILVAQSIGILFSYLKISQVFGYILAGIILSPYALGSIVIAEHQLITLNDHVITLARIGALLLCFLVGLEISFTDFKKTKAKSSALAFSNIILPLMFGSLAYRALGETWITSIVAAACLTTSSIPAVIEHLHKPGIPKDLASKITVNAAALSNISGILILSILVSLIESGITPNLSTLYWLIIKTILLSVVLLLVTILAVPSLIIRINKWNVYLGRAGGTVEILVTAFCFGCAAVAWSIGLSPLIGALIAGVAVADTHILPRAKDYIEKVSFLFAPIFFVIIGAQVNIGSLNPATALGAIVLIGVVLVSNILGGLPAYAIIRDRVKGLRIGISMVPQGKVGLIIAGVSLSTAAISSSVYVQIIVMSVFITLLAPKLLSMLSKR